MFNKKLLGLAIGATLLTTAHNSFAGNSSATANYEITLGAACTVVATGQIFPGQMAGVMTDLFNTPAGTVTVTCNPGVLYDWGINGGTHLGMFWGSRHMQSPVTMQNIPYELYYNGMGIGEDGLQMLDPSFTPTLWWPSASSISGLQTGTGIAQTYPLTSSVYLSAMGMPYMAGTYTDTVTVTVAFL
jgi:spore coat protein U-like protein